MLYDTFICHASEDKDDFVRPLAEELKSWQIEVWYDEFALKPGDSLRQSIDHGLSSSRYGIVVMSTAFFKKQWPQWELDGLVQRQLSDSANIIIPIWHGVTKEQIMEYSPPLANIVAINSEKGVPAVAKEIADVVHRQGSNLMIARKKVFKLEDHFWNPQGLERATAKFHAVALRDITVVLSQALDDHTKIEVLVTYRLISHELRSIGYEHAPWLHLVFLDMQRHVLPVEEARHWEVLEFEPYEDRTIKKQKRIRCSYFSEIADVRIEFSRGYEGSDFPLDGQPRPSISARIRHFLGRWRRRLKGNRNF